MRWPGSRCPVWPEEREWIERSLLWMAAEFGRSALYRPVALPTAEFFPHPYEGTVDDVRLVLDRVCAQMGADADATDLELVEDADLRLVDGEHSPPDGTAGDDLGGTWLRRGDRFVVAVRSTLATRPRWLVAALAHQVGHVRLLGEQRIADTRPDREPLVDLLTVYAGLGVFTANAAFEVEKSSSSPLSPSYLRLPVRRFAYLTEPMLGYALAHYTRLRDDPRPSWIGYLDTNPRVYLKKSLRYLRRRGGP